MIVHGPVKSGKTTRLARWSAGRNGIAGILQPGDLAGRAFCDIATGERCALEPVPAGARAIEVGRYRFRADAFAWANDRITAAVDDDKARAIIIDEVGPLELGGRGLHPGIAAALARSGGTLILVVRDQLVDAVRARLAIAHPRVVASADWPQEAGGSAP